MFCSTLIRVLRQDDQMASSGIGEAQEFIRCVCWKLWTHPLPLKSSEVSNRSINKEDWAFSVAIYQEICLWKERKDYSFPVDQGQRFQVNKYKIILAALIQNVLILVSSFECISIWVKAP